jgi:hypothetical protein
MKTEEWRRSPARDFWGGIGPGDHVVQIYDDEQSFLSLLEGFVIGGFDANACVVVIATEEHLLALENRLRFQGHNLFELKLQNQYVPLSARDTLSEFMINNWPDEMLFRHVMNRHIAKARTMQRNVRAFGEMVTLLWSGGHSGATVQLENLWNKICQIEGLSLFCSYPRTVFNQSALEAILDICGSQSKMIKLSNDSNHEILYKEIQYKGNKQEAL